MRYLIDTNVAVAITRGNPICVRNRLKRAFEATDTVLVSAISVFELWYGAAQGPDPITHSQLVLEFLSGGIEVISFDGDVSAVAGRIRATLKRRGTPIGPYDILIAAQAIAADATLVTSNLAEFHRVGGLMIEDWTT